VNGMTSELTGTVKDMDLRFSITVSGTFSGKRAKG
jgi:hypothetical protein